MVYVNSKIRILELSISIKYVNKNLFSENSDFNYLQQIGPRRIENFFNRCIEQLAKQGVFPKVIHAVCDTTLYETTNKFKECGCVTRQRKVKARSYRKSGELKEVSVTLYGRKVWAIYEIKTSHIINIH